MDRARYHVGDPVKILFGVNRDAYVYIFNTDAADTEAIAHRLEKAGIDRGPVSFSLGWAARENSESFEETVNRADRQLIQVRVALRPEAYTRRAAAEKE